MLGCKGRLQEEQKLIIRALGHFILCQFDERRKSYVEEEVATSEQLVHEMQWHVVQILTHNLSLNPSVRLSVVATTWRL